MEVNYIEVTAKELQRCPAEIDMESGVISINKDVWDQYDQFQKNFIIWHELGHFNLQTDSETEADKYALAQVAGTAEKSLKRALQTLYKVGIINSERLWAMYEECLKIDSRGGNQAAAIELQNLQEEKRNYRTKTENKMKYINAQRRRADGQEVETVEVSEKKNKDDKSHKTNGVKIGSVYFSFTNILLMVIAIMLFVLLRKTR